MEKTTKISFSTNFIPPPGYKFVNSSNNLGENKDVSSEEEKEASSKDKVETQEDNNFLWDPDMRIMY